MLHGTFVDDGEMAPVLLLSDDGPEILDGRHRLAALVARAVEEATAIVGLAEGLSPHVLDRFLPDGLVPSSEVTLPAPP